MIEPRLPPLMTRLYREVLGVRWPYELRGRVHTHPSLNCYKNHKCRCRECSVIGTAYMREKRAERRVPAVYVKRTRKWGGTVLPEEELKRLRREAGLE